MFFFVISPKVPNASARARGIFLLGTTFVSSYLKCIYRTHVFGQNAICSIATER